MLQYDAEVVLVDTGFSPEAAVEKHVVDYRDPCEQLARLGLSPSDVGTVIVSHLHWDHFHTPQRFPNARLFIQRSDIEYYLGRGQNHPLAVELGDRASLDELRALIAADRVTALDGDQVIRPGLRVERIAGHSPGMQMTVLDLDSGPLVLAGDASHLFVNLQTRTPTALLNDYDAYQRGFDRITAVSAGGRWLPGHDPLMLDELETIGGGIYRAHPRS
ncbi:N-acyl homoserine lactonase family protein [Microbacterium soli]|uniref:N-acyl homoserine lactonase family protein n=1 Tax=Microbacterium soli TaxID=446075 RepID=A0ABP7MLN8_9MICO